MHGGAVVLDVIHLLKQRREPDRRHTQSLQVIGLLDHPLKIAAPVVPPSAAAGVEQPLPSHCIVISAVVVKTVDHNEIDGFLAELHLGGDQKACF